jgi:hypothetical protein
MNVRRGSLFMAAVFLSLAPLAAQTPARIEHYFCDWDNLSRLLGPFDPAASKSFSEAVRNVSGEPPVSISFSRDGFVYAGAGELFGPALRDLLSGAVAKGDRWALEIFLNTVNERGLVRGLLSALPGGLFRSKLCLAPGKVKDQLALTILNENSSGGMSGQIVLDFPSTAPSLRNVRIPAPTPAAVSTPPASWMDRLDLTKILAPLSGKDKPSSPEDGGTSSALTRRAEEIETIVGTSGILDEALAGAGGFPLALGKAAAVTQYPGFPSEDPCNKEA